MQFAELVQEVLKTGCLTPNLESQISQLLWSKSFNEVELQAAEQLTQALSNGTVRYYHPWW